MELRYPILMIIIIILIILYLVFFKRKKCKYTNGTKIANTEYIKNTDYYQKRLKIYNILKRILYILFGSGIIASIVLITRLAKVETQNTFQYNRDIFLCMDVSSSVDELNLEIVKTLENTVKELNGERFGISIFNTSSVILTPLTDDYDYVIETLELIGEAIEAVNDTTTSISDYDNYLYLANYIISGTLDGLESRGTSLIGDGLASCVYDFSNLEDTDRTRIIILSTDNELAGSPLVTLETAAKISNSKKVKVYGIGTKYMSQENSLSFKSAVESTGGKYYEHSSKTVDNIVSDIDNTSKSLLQNQVETKVLDIPEIPFIILLISIIGIITLRKVVL